MDQLTRGVLSRLLEWGADLVGVAPVERFENAPEGHKPTDSMPECKSVISIALHLFDGMADVWGEHDVSEKTIICGDFCGKCLHKCPSKKLCTKDLQDYDLSSRHSPINESRL